MSIWRVEPQNPNKVTEIQNWYKGYSKLVRRQQFAYCSFLSDSPEEPNLPSNVPGGIELTKGTPYNWNLERLDEREGGPWVTWEFPADMSSEEQERITKLIDLDMYTNLEQDGWTHESAEYWVSGPLIITRIR
jgi:hypothetical protein